MVWYIIAAVLLTSWTVCFTVIVVAMARATRRVPAKVVTARLRKNRGRAVAA